MCNNNVILGAIVLILVVMFYMSQHKKPHMLKNYGEYDDMQNLGSFEHMTDNHAPFNPNNRLSKDAEKNGFVGLPNDSDYPWTNVNSTKYGEVDSLLGDDLNDLNFGLCSKSCCTQQYPLPFSLPADKFVQQAIAEGKEFVPSNYTCNNSWQDTGCMCMTKKDAKLLSARGMNA